MIALEEFFSSLNEFIKKYKRFVLMLLLILAAFLVIRTLPIVIMLMMPFVIGYIVSLAAYPLVKFLKNKLHVPYKVGALITVLLLLLVLSLAVTFIVSAVSDFSGVIIENWDDLYSSFAATLESALKALERWSDSLPFDFFEDVLKNFGEIEIKSDGGMLFDFGKSVSGWIRPFAGSLAGGTINVVKSLPEVLVFVVMLILSTYFFTSEREKIKALYLRHTSDNFKEKLKLIKKECFGALFGYLKAQLILSAITAAELFVGLMILGVKHTLLLSVIIALIDLLPVFGTGTVLIPWALINILSGGTLYFSAGMIILYLICLSVRNLLQPKVLSSNIGLDPLLTLIAVWLGYKLYGFIGMILLPLGALILYKLYDIGIFDWFFLSHRRVTEEQKEAAELAAKADKK